MKTINYQGIKIGNIVVGQVEDTLTLEQPLAVQINGTPFTLTMQTPGNERQLARGLLFTEGVCKIRSGELFMEILEINESGFISTINVILSDEQYDKSQLNKRNLLSVSSCGVCGKTELNILEKKELEAIGAFQFQNISDMFEAMAAKQTVFIASGGCHGAAIFTKDYEMVSVMEDIGRHNAVDKVIGDLLIRAELKKAQYLLVSGRVSYEIVTKCFIAGIPFLMAVSAPSSLAVDYAKELGITLVGFCRNDRATVYSHPERMKM